MNITDEMIQRINELAKKAKEESLSPEEKLEQQQLRQAYVEAFRSNLKATLETIVVVDENGNEKKIEKKPTIDTKHLN